MVSRSLAAIVLLGSLLASAIQAHAPDTSYARIRITRHALDCKFTYDLFTLVRVIPGLDADADRRISDVELTAKSPDIFDFISKVVQLEIDGKKADFGNQQAVEFPPDVGTSIPEQEYHAATSLIHFAFHKDLVTPPGDIWVQFEFFHEISELHTVLGAIEHEGEEYEVLFRHYEPDYLFDTGYSVESPAAVPNNNGTGAEQVSAATVSKPNARSNTNHSIWQQLASFFWLGVEHIFIGIDHILFLLSLLVVCKFQELIKIVTSFTVAHTITLILATLEVVQLPGRFVETAIAATIVYVAVENFWIKETSRRWILTFAFGLIHGFGFAGVLKELGLPTVGLVRSLVSFNVGVEAGQLVIVSAFFPAIVAISYWKHERFVRMTVSLLIALCGLGWFLDRAFGLGWMPI